MSDYTFKPSEFLEHTYALIKHPKSSTKREVYTPHPSSELRRAGLTFHPEDQYTSLFTYTITGSGTASLQETGSGRYYGPLNLVLPPAFIKNMHDYQEILRKCEKCPKSNAFQSLRHPNFTWGVENITSNDPLPAITKETLPTNLQAVIAMSSPKYTPFGKGYLLTRNSMRQGVQRLIISSDFATVTSVGYGKEPSDFIDEVQTANLKDLSLDVGMSLDDAIRKMIFHWYHMPK